MEEINIASPAKLNLCLEVVKKYKNGFHEINSVFIKSKFLVDDVSVIFFDDNKEKISIKCNNPNIPTNEKNICWMIAESFFEKSNKRTDIEIIINKRIPSLAGLGGGSSNGASVLLALNKFFDNVLNDEELIEVAAKVGKDMPFFLNDKIASYVSGSGENVRGIDKFPELNILVVVPNISISTPWAYQQLDKYQWFMNDNRRKKIAFNMQKYAKNSQDVARYIYNDFSLTAKQKCDKIEEIQNAMRAFGAMAVSISGKGPTTFGLFESSYDLEIVKSILKKEYKDFFITRF